MEKNKQIEEMACDMCTVILNCNEPYKPIPSCVAYKQAKRAVEKGYRKQSEWISVEERLPEDDGFVLLCTSKGAIIKGHYEHKYGRWSGLNNRLNVTHWMPLPEAPKMKGGAK